MGVNFAPFLSRSIAQIYESLHPGAPLWMFMSWREWSTMDLELRRGDRFHWSSTILYAKDSFTLSNCDFHPQHEGCWYGWRADAPRLCPVEARDIGDLWSFSRPTVGQQGEHHPTEKPVELVGRALRHTTRRGDLVLDPFGGGGSTLLAAERTGRRAVLVELEPRWVDYAVSRWEHATGGRAELFREAI
jgi:DNA modification methylase